MADDGPSRQERVEQDTSTLRKLWSHGAKRILDDIRSEKPVDVAEVEKLQKSLEAIEAREELEDLNAIARGDRDAARS